MDFRRILTVIREKIGETDLVVSDLTDPELLAVIKTSQEILDLRGLLAVASLVVGTDQTDVATYGIVPEPTTEAGHYLAIHAALAILRSEYYAKIKTGTLGVSWRSGLEGESTLGAEKAWRMVIAGLEDEFEQLFIIRNTTSSGVRSQ